MELSTTTWHVALIFGVGMFAGFLNTIAAGGSLISVPALILIGLPSNVANATNRVAIIGQNISAIKGFESKGISAYPYSLYLGLSALLGAIIGARIAVDIQGEVFNKILAVTMILVVAYTFFKPNQPKFYNEENLTLKAQIIGIFLFFFVGIYGGFIQAGVGFFILAILSALNHFGLAKANYAKVYVVLIYTLSAVVIFAIEGMINWQYGFLLAAGNVLGGWFGSRWSVDTQEKWVKYFLLITVTVLAINLWFF